ncbi:MAG: (deoxy)nucleoside triphosphate pyrophosphohydrolase [Desulfovibrio sp.]|nr:(deoxy)nucleoside triphosphate pyrophosphohydrolase [Desulfovibrio sp.]
MTLKDRKDPIEVSAAIIYRRGLILATQRPDDAPWSGYWEFPGGKREGSETPARTLLRELAEELGIKAKEYRLLKTIDHAYDDYSVRLSFFLVTSYNGAPCPREEQNMRWIRPEDLDELHFLPADTEMLKILKSERELLPWETPER